MNKQGKGSGGVTTILVLAVVLFVAGSLYWMYGGQMQSTTPTPGGVQPTPVSGQVFCPSDGSSDGKVRYLDTMAASVSYLAPTVYFVPEAGQALPWVTAGTLQTDGTYSTAASLTCTAQGTKYKPVAVGLKGGAHSAEGDAFLVQGDAVNRELRGKAYGDLQIRAEDMETGGATFLNVSSQNSVGGNASSATTFTRFDGKSYIVLNNNAASGSSLTVGTDGHINIKLYVKANATKKQFGEDGLKTWLVVDADSSDWSEPQVNKNNGPTLVNELNSLQPKDKTKYSGYEYAYDIGTFNGDRTDFVDIYLQAASGVNPSQDPLFEFCSESRYKSSMQQDTILVGCWTDAATQTQVSTPNRHRIAVNIV